VTAGDRDKGGIEDDEPPTLLLVFALISCMAVLSNLRRPVEVTNRRKEGRRRGVSEGGNLSGTIVK